MKTKVYNYRNIFKLFLLCVSIMLCFSTFTIITEGINEQKLYAASWASKTEAPSRTATINGVNYKLIEKPQHLAYIMANMATASIRSGKYTLTQNLDMSGYTWTAIGAYTSTIYSFTGVFDGAGYVITNLTSDSTKTYSGLFASTSNATIKNVSLSNCIFEGVNYVGGIASYATSSSLDNCILNDCKLTVKYSSSINLYAGGAVGYAASSNISKIYINSSQASYYINGDESYKGINTFYSTMHVGGIVGYASSTNISNCINNMQVSTNSFPKNAYTGGIVGYATGGEIKQCGNQHNVIGGRTESSTTSYTGGIAGYTNATITDCYNIGSKVDGYAKNQSTTEKITQLSRSQEGISSTNGWSGVIGQDNKYWYITTTNLDSPPLAHQRTITYNYAYAGGIAGYAKSIKTSYTSEDTAVSGGKKSYSDNYMAIYSYTQEKWQYNILWWSSYNNNNARTYFITFTYVTELYNSKIAGSRSSSLTNCYASTAYDTSQNYSYVVNVWENGADKKSWGLGGLLDLLNLIPHGNDDSSKVGYKSGTGSGSGKISLANNTHSSGKDLQEYFSRNQSIGFYANFTDSSFYMDSYTNHNGSSKYYKLTDNVSISRGTPTGYKTRPAGFKNTTLTNVNPNFSSSIWVTSSNINNGYPRIIGNFW